MRGHVLICVPFFFTCSRLFAQTAVLSGSVTVVPDGLPLRDAYVTLKATDGPDQRMVLTASDGVYRFEHLQANQTYRLSIESPGLQRFQRDGIQLGTGQSYRIDVAL